jgi:hypothetical protein
VVPAVRFDDGLSALVTGEPWQPVAEGLGFTEGPVWHPDGFLLFSDIPNSRIHRSQDGRLDVYREPSGQSNGLTLDAGMRLIACEHETRRVSIERDGVVEALAAQYEGKRLNSPNDVVALRWPHLLHRPAYGITNSGRRTTACYDRRRGSQLFATDFVPERPALARRRIVYRRHRRTTCARSRSRRRAEQRPRLPGVRGKPAGA